MLAWIKKGFETMKNFTVTAETSYDELKNVFPMEESFTVNNIDIEYLGITFDGEMAYEFDGLIVDRDRLLELIYAMCLADDIMLDKGVLLTEATETDDFSFVEELQKLISKLETFEFCQPRTEALDEIIRLARKYDRIPSVEL